MADSPNKKIQDLEDLATTIASLKAKGKRVAHCHGVFDLLHIGHVRHFQKAREFGDVLVVTLTPDAYVNKGPHRPAFNQNLRAEFLANLDCIDYVAVNKWPNAVETLKLLKPNFYVKGSDYKDFAKDVTGGIVAEEDAVNSVGGELVFTEDIVFSSSALINRHMSSLPKEAAEWLGDFSKRHPADDVVQYLEAARGLRVLIVGETIIDDYHYCETLGKSGKEPILAVRYKSSEKFAGGVIAVANHAAQFCDRVDVISALGEDDTQEQFIREHLNSRVKPTFLYQAGTPTIVKRRFIESYPFQKMFEVYLMNDDARERENTSKLCAELEHRLADYDLVIVADYGHHLIAPEVVQVLSSKRTKCLAVNTQANAANHGYNTVCKYPRADYVCVSENEIRLEARRRREDINEIVTDVSAKIGASRIMITRGQRGLLCYDKAEGFVTAPALAGHFVDRVGAGDAVFAITSLVMRQGAPSEVMGVIGNAVGAMAVTTIGNRAPVDKPALVKFVTSILK